MGGQSVSVAGTGGPHAKRTLPVDVGPAGASGRVEPNRAADALDRACRSVLEANWYRSGYTVPNLATYPYQWLWDSCFHAIVWAHLGEADRALSELGHLFRTQDGAGFVPHVDYEVAPEVQAGFWGRSGSSSITQPPLYGHALAELARRAIEVPPDLVDAAGAGLRFLLRDRARDERSGLITIVHPWESGADDSPRWDHWSGGGWELSRWYDRKGELVASIDRSAEGSPTANRDFGAAPVGFNALVAFNARELATAFGGDDLVRGAEEIEAALDERWDDLLGTWVDAGPSAATSGRTRTLEGLLPLLVATDAARVDRVLGDLVDPDAHGARFGPRGVHRSEPVYGANTYWRGPAWPQLTYLMWIAAQRHRRDEASGQLGRALVDGAWSSGFAEYWNADTGEGLGARPQSWATLAALVSRGGQPDRSGLTDLA